MSNPYDDSQALTDKLVRWSVFHAAGLICLTIFALISGSLWLVSIAGAVSFLVLILSVYPIRTAWKTFGWANGVTAMRLGGILILGPLSTEINGLWVIVISLVLLMGDGVDGWLARRLNQASEFGEYFDKETDAFFILVLTLSILANQRLGSWILMVALLRYVFVLFLHFYPPRAYKENRSIRGRLIYLLVMVALFACFLPFPALYSSLAVIATLSLIYSFVKDLQWMYRLE